MGIRFLYRRAIVGPLDRLGCAVRIDSTKPQIARINIMSCCRDRFNLCIDQSEDRAFTLYDSTAVDFTGATALTVTVYQGRNGAELLQKALADGDVVFPADNKIQFSITDTESAALPTGTHRVEVWGVSSGGARFDALGWLRVTYTKGP